MSEQTQDIKSLLKPLFEEHNYNKTYDYLTIVTYTSDNVTNFYQAIRNVPRFTPITDVRFWKLMNTASTEPTEPTEPDYLCFTAESDTAELALVGATTYDNIQDYFALEYSTDKTNWENLEFTSESNNGMFVVSSNVISFTKGDKVYFRGDNINGTCNVDSDTMTGYMFMFKSDSDGVFSVSGDLQTIVDKTGQDKEHGVFSGEGGLFSVNEMNEHLNIITAPNLTATTLLPGKYANLFINQTKLQQPANMPSFTTSDLPIIDDGSLGCFENMYYGCSGLEEPADFNNLTVTSYEDDELIRSNLLHIYIDTSFNITDDNGDTLNGFAGLTFPYESSDSEITSYMFAESLGNTNGFQVPVENPINIIIPTSEDYEVSNVVFYAGKIAIRDLTSSIVDNEIIYDANPSHYELFTPPEGITITINTNVNTSITGWKYSTDGVNWIDTELPVQASINIKIPTVGTHYYKPTCVVHK